MAKVIVQKKFINILLKDSFWKTKIQKLFLMLKYKGKLWLITNQKRKIKDWEKIIPNQKFITDLYKEKSPIEKSILEFILNVCKIKPPKERFLLEESELFSIEEMASSPIALMFIEFLLKIINAKRVLEIGTFVGVCSLSMARIIPEDGKIVTIEKFDKFAEIAKKNF